VDGLWDCEAEAFGDFRRSDQLIDLDASAHGW
jgi:hypothetical protein